MIFPVPFPASRGIWPARDEFAPHCLPSQPFNGLEFSLSGYPETRARRIRRQTGVKRERVEAGVDHGAVLVADASRRPGSGVAGGVSPIRLDSFALRLSRVSRTGAALCQFRD